MKYLSLAIFFSLLLTFGAVTRAQAQPRNSTPVQETDDEYKVVTYKKFVDNREPNPAVAYRAAKDYMAKYGKEDDQYTRYLRQWIAIYEEDERAMRLAAEKARRAGAALREAFRASQPTVPGLALAAFRDAEADLTTRLAPAEHIRLSRRASG